MSEDMFYCSFVSIHYIICECGETFPSEEELKDHLEKAHVPKKETERTEYKCGICCALYDTEEECLEHYEQSHIKLEEESEYTVEDLHDNEDVKKEDIIIQEFFKAEPIGQNVTIQSRSEDRQRKRKPKNQPKNIVCEVCGKRYASNAALKYHQRVHTGERPYKCTMCDKTFTMPLFLQIHLRTHTGEKPYECPLCPKAFGNRAALLRHSRVHTGIKPYQCPRCGKFFTQSNSMKLHVNTVHLKMPAPYKSKTRRLRAQEREMMRIAALNKTGKSEDELAVPSMKAESNLLNQNMATLNLVEIKHQDLKKELEVENFYEDVDPKEITYEVVYEQ